MNLWIVRHGQTAWNIQRRFQGISDIPLDADGIQQAENLAQRLKAIRFTAIYASPLSRSLQTAQIIAAHSIDAPPIQTTPDLMEISFGEYEGASIPALEQVLPPDFRTYRYTPSKATLPGGDCIAQRAQQLRSFLDGLDQQYGESDDVLLSAPGYLIRMMLTMFMHASLDLLNIFRIGNTALTLVQYTGGQARIFLVGDTSHNRGGRLA